MYTSRVKSKAPAIRNTTAPTANDAPNSAPVLLSPGDFVGSEPSWLLVVTAMTGFSTTSVLERKSLQRRLILCDYAMRMRPPSTWHVDATFLVQSDIFQRRIVNLYVPQRVIALWREHETAPRSQCEVGEPCKRRSAVSYFDVIRAAPCADSLRQPRPTVAADVVIVAHERSDNVPALRIDVYVWTSQQGCVEKTQLVPRPFVVEVVVQEATFP